MEQRWVGEYRAGAAVRRYVRRELNEAGYQWTERKGLVESVFVVTGSREQHARLDAWIAAVKAAS